MTHRSIPALADTFKLGAGAFLILAVAACGGGGSSPSADEGHPGEPLAFPTGVAVTSPSALGDSSSVIASLGISMRLSLSTRISDWTHAMWRALDQGDTRTVGTLMARLVPIGQAHAGTAKVPEGLVVASEIEAVARGLVPLSTAGLLDLSQLFNTNAVNAQCFGPAVPYANHDDYVAGTPAATGTLPSGDLGMWLDLEPGGTTPCATAQIDQRLGSVKGQYKQGMLLMAALRHAIADSTTLRMPTASHATDVTVALSAELASVPSASGVTVESATLALDSSGTLYTYRLVISAGSGANARTSEIVIQHSPGPSDEVFNGVLQITASQLSNDAAFGCTDEIDTGTSLYKVATATSLRYIRNGTQVHANARSANYCGAPSPASTSHITDIATLTIDGELDLGIDLGGGNTRGSINGWRGNASRFAATVDLDVQTGVFLYAWQAGNLDDHARAFAVHSAYDSGTEARTLQAYYAFTEAIGATDGTLVGMICNWAGPGNHHTPQTMFQSQRAVLPASATTWSLEAGGSNISYAPTNSCDSSPGMSFDADADQTIDAGEGANTTNTLDRLSSYPDLEQELAARGYTIPALF